MKFKIATLILLLALFSVFPNQAYSRDIKLVIDKIEDGVLKASAFEMKSDGILRIKAVGFVGPYTDAINAYTWILESNSRDEIWRLTVNNTDGSGKDDKKREFDSRVELDKGTYEVYYYANDNIFNSIKIKGPGEVFDVLGDLFTGSSNEDWEDMLEEAKIEISGSDAYFRPISNYSNFKPVLKDDALVEHIKLGDNFYDKIYFRIKEPTELSIYHIGEYTKSGRQAVDGAWIVDLSTGKRIWEPDRWSTEHAGGASKNRKFDGEVRFNKGDYVIYCYTDGSHSFESWNSNPPSDPYLWGIRISPGDDYKKGSFEIMDEPETERPLLSITRVGDNAYEQKSFKLKDDSDLRVYCIGEYWLSNRTFADYGWIKDNSSNEIVWEINYKNSEHAGGASKNRMFNGIVRLPEGSYTVVYTSDGSHSYNDWNAAAPFDAHQYGISIYPTTADYDRDKFELIENPEQSGDVLIRMVGLGNDIKHHRSFTLSKPMRVNIYAIGEGDRNEMYDYGWIERDDNGLVVWEMTYRNTRPAGGASKNRMFNGEIMLDKGTYKAYFVTDGSHSFNKWNAPKPRDPAGWGLTVTKR
ncbi:MAG: hypothetical protein GF307_01515 [candidate division Zixibacteria bacterium]|nr:hypothetical protein [candidate division Zixibacteria bacterium]